MDFYDMTFHATAMKKKILLIAPLVDVPGTAYFRFCRNVVKVTHFQWAQLLFNLVRIIWSWQTHTLWLIVSFSLVSTSCFLFLFFLANAAHLQVTWLICPWVQCNEESDLTTPTPKHFAKYHNPLHPCHSGGGCNTKSKYHTCAMFRDFLFNQTGLILFLMYYSMAWRYEIRKRQTDVWGWWERS